MSRIMKIDIRVYNEMFSEYKNSSLAIVNICLLTFIEIIVSMSLTFIFIRNLTMNWMIPLNEFSGYAIAHTNKPKLDPLGRTNWWPKLDRHQQPWPPPAEKKVDLHQRLKLNPHQRLELDLPTKKAELTQVAKAQHTPAAKAWTKWPTLVAMTRTSGQSRNWL